MAADVGKLARPAPSLRKSKGCILCNRFNGETLIGLLLILLGGDVVETGPLLFDDGNFIKLSGDE